jgi:DNA-binding transcriptional LysR family regulator
MPTRPAGIRRLIRDMSVANPLWGARRIHGELLKLGIDVGQTAVAKYMARRRQPPSQGWKTFLRNHADGIASMDALEGRLTVNDPELAIRAELDGVGVLYTALGYAAPEISLKAGRLVPVLEDWRTSSAAIFLYYPIRRQVPAPLQAFREFLRKNLRAH